MSLTRLCLLWGACACTRAAALPAELPAQPVFSATLPPLSYRYAVFAVPKPEEAASFMTRFTGAVPVNRTEYQLSEASIGNAEVSGVRLFFGGDDNASAWSDVYFMRDDSLPGSSAVQQFTERVSGTHSMANDDWDWWQDWHLAFSVTDIDAVAAKLLRADVRFVSRGSIYFAIPGTAVTIQVLGHGSGDVYWTEPFLFCRRTSDRGTGRTAPYPLNTSDLAALPDRPLPPFVPSHQSLATADANATAAWAYKFLNVSRVAASTGPGESHAYAGGRCAQIQWMELSPGGWELHFIEQFVKREGRQSVAGWEATARALHGSMAHSDAAHNFRVGLSVSTLAPYVANLQAHGERFFRDPVDPRRIRVQTPSGYVLELFESGSGSRDLSGSPALAATGARPRLRGADRASAAEAAIVAAIHE